MMPFQLIGTPAICSRFPLLRITLHNIPEGPINLPNPLSGSDVAGRKSGLPFQYRRAR
jgi:hypothetical protein